jgi:hypothetical protein
MRETTAGYQEQVANQEVGSADARSTVDAKSTGEKDRNEARCSCGHDRDHYMVEPVPEYSTSGWLTVIFGISTIPKRIKYRCCCCKEIIDETTDPEILRGNIS